MDFRLDNQEQITPSAFSLLHVRTHMWARKSGRGTSRRTSERRNRILILENSIVFRGSPYAARTPNIRLSSSRCMNIRPRAEVYEKRRVQMLQPRAYADSHSESPRWRRKWKFKSILTQILREGWKKNTTFGEIKKMALRLHKSRCWISLQGLPLVKQKKKIFNSAKCAEDFGLK